MTAPPKIDTAWGLPSPLGKEKQFSPDAFIAVILTSPGGRSGKVTTDDIELLTVVP